MSPIMLYIFGTISTLIMVFGMEGRGTWSRNIAILGGNLWFISVVVAFWILGIRNGFIYLLGTFIFAYILQRILRPFLNPHGH